MDLGGLGFGIVARPGLRVRVSVRAWIGVMVRCCGKARVRARTKIAGNMRVRVSVSVLIRVGVTRVLL